MIHPVETARKRSWRAEFFQLALFLALMTVFRSSFADHYHVPTGSMEYTLMPGDRVIVDKMAYGIRIPLTTVDLLAASAPARGDVAVFDSPLDGTRLIKRIVAIGGDEVSLQDGLLVVNGRPMGDARREQFEGHEALLNLASGGGADIPFLRIPSGMVLAVGDHRGNSLDGRYFGLVADEAIIGRAMGIYYRRGEGFGWRSL
ncbi:MAG TPA: signal peptidase I [Steroidobacteraceae bacterium]|nr:signal peptidase I [Steroidobacteraceae bacterium]